MTEYMKEAEALVDKHAACRYMPTNREYLARMLADPDWLDDGGAAWEAMVNYNINCPYLGNDERAHCHGKSLDYVTGPDSREHCVACKMEWLEQEVDS